MCSSSTESCFGTCVGIETVVFFWKWILCISYSYIYIYIYIYMGPKAIEHVGPVPFGLSGECLEPLEGPQSCLFSADRKDLPNQFRRLPTSQQLRKTRRKRDKVGQVLIYPLKMRKMMASMQEMERMESWQKNDFVGKVGLTSFFSLNFLGWTLEFLEFQPRFLKH